MALVRRLMCMSERPDLLEARKDNLEARESFLEAVRQAAERGSSITLSQEALERIVKVEPVR